MRLRVEARCPRRQHRPPRAGRFNRGRYADAPSPTLPSLTLPSLSHMAEWHHWPPLLGRAVFLARDASRAPGAAERRARAAIHSQGHIANAAMPNSSLTLEGALRAGHHRSDEQNDADPIAGIRRRPRARARRVCGRGAAGVPAAAACRRASARKAAKPHARVARATTAWCLGRRDRGPRRGGKAEVRGRARARQCRAAATPGHLSEQSSGPRRAPRPAAACCADPDRRARDRTNARAH